MLHIMYWDDTGGMALITYDINGKLYINLTNRCSNSCSFCIRNTCDGVGYDLWLEKEPAAEEVIETMGKADEYEEIVFCGYGEPTERLRELLEVARHAKALGKTVRLDTNGQGSLIWGRNIAPELEELVDAISISLNAADAGQYDELCRSDFGRRAYEAVIEFARECKKYIPEVTLTVVDIISASDIEKCSKIAKQLGVGFRVRRYYK